MTHYIYGYKRKIAETLSRKLPYENDEKYF